MPILQGKLQSSMVTGLMFARMRQAAVLGRRSEKSRHFSEPSVFVAKVARRQKNQLTFSCNRQQTHQNIQNIKNNRSFGKRKTFLLRNIFIFLYGPNERALNDCYILNKKTLSSLKITAVTSDHLEVTGRCHT